jgi:hypothetical protein
VHRHTGIPVEVLGLRDPEGEQFLGGAFGMHHGHDLMNRLMGVDERSSSSASSASRDVQTLCSCCSFAAA